MKNTIRFCEDIGMYVIDRPRAFSCVHRTSFCEETCYNIKLERAFPKILERDKKNEDFWQNTDAFTMRKILKRKTKGTKRIRLCTRGEPFRDATDVKRIQEWVYINPEWTWWIPTRAWREPGLRESIELEIMDALPNARVMASIDPSTEESTHDFLYRKGWPRLYYGDNNYSSMYPTFRCPKTWKKLKGHCAVCKGGCFSNGRAQVVHLKQH